MARILAYELVYSFLVTPRRSEQVYDMSLFKDQEGTDDLWSIVINNKYA
jgi:hypothetical protein